MNHEYADDGLLHPDGMKTWSAEKVRKAQAAHGVVGDRGRAEGRPLADGAAVAVRAPHHRRHADDVRRPGRRPRAAAHRRRPARAARVLGTFNNCASGITPWGTYLTCEENFVFYFNGPDAARRARARAGACARATRPATAGTSTTSASTRRKHPNEPNRFGWVVEIDPFDSELDAGQAHRARPRRARRRHGRGRRKDGRAVVYIGRGRALRVHLQVRQPRPRSRPAARAANAELLDHGTLYVARFDADGSGRWLPLAHGQGPLTAANGFADQGEVLIKTRQASDALGATKMDRPEWIAVDTQRGEVYCTLTNNSNRGGAKQPGVDAANPRANNTMGHIIRWKEDGDFDGATLPLEPLRAGRRPGQRARRGQGQRQGRHVRLPRRPVGRRARRAVDPDRHVAPRRWARATSRTSATTRCSPPTRAPARSAASSPARPAARSPASPARPTGARCSSTSSIRARARANAATRPSRGRSPTGPTSGRGRPRSATVVIRKLDGGVIGT